MALALVIESNLQVVAVNPATASLALEKVLSAGRLGRRWICGIGPTPENCPKIEDSHSVTRHSFATSQPQGCSLRSRDVSDQLSC